MTHPPAARRTGQMLRTGANYALMTCLTLLFASPVLYLFIGSLKPSAQVLDGLSGLIPRDLSFDNYIGVHDSLNSPSTGYLWHFLLVSLVVTGAVVASGLVVNSLAAYAFARLSWPGRDALLVMVIALIAVPFEAVAVPLFYMLNDARDTLHVLVLPFIANAFSIFLFYSHFIDLPKSTEEAALIDGAGPWRIFFSIVVPNSKPAFATVAILTFLSQWGSFLWPVLMVSDPSVRTLPLELSVFSAQLPVDWGRVFAFGVILVAPVLIIFVLFQRWFVESVANSGLKG
ncbi:carbohydrate ABC transporter permease [Streptomyces sp. NPDC093591]|uniref:carbohydrate ABC transporter permease n=1 Tax=Streptomyces sp. NPDC093591 TaxID=3366044 RepID=UPI0037FCB13C